MIEIPIKNERQRQTYYGALNDQTHKFMVNEYSIGNSENIGDFIKHLQKEKPGKKLAILGIVLVMINFRNLNNI